MSRRKIIRIVELNKALVALCDDGSLFQFRGIEEGWKAFPEIPQPKESDKF